MNELRIRDKHNHTNNIGIFTRQDSQSTVTDHNNNNTIRRSSSDTKRNKAMNTAVAALGLAALISILVSSQAKSICTNKSPINIPMASFTTRCEASHGNLLGKVLRWRKTRRTRWKVINTGDGIKINVERGDVFTVLDDGTELRVNYMMLKWGNSDSTGSDHAIDRSRFAAELQIHHHKHGVYGLQAFAFLIKERHNPPNYKWKSIFKTIRRTLSVGASAKMSSPPSIESILGDSFARHRIGLVHLVKHSIRYQGTNNRCKSVWWSVFPLKLHLSSRQLHYLRQVSKTTEGEAMSTRRPISPAVGLCMFGNN